MSIPMNIICLYQLFHYFCLKNSHMKNKKLFHSLIVLSISSLGQLVNGQTIGNWNSSSAQTITPNAVGIGTTTPNAWEEIEYCQNTQTGLIVSKDKYCNSGGGGVFTINYSGSLWDNSTQSNFLEGGDEIYLKSIPVSFEYLPVLSNPSRPYTGGNLISFPMYAGGQPLIWAREKNASTLNSFGTRFIVTPDGRVGINMPSPRAPLDVRGSYDYNVPIAIFGINSNNFTRHLHMVANLGTGAYNNISQNGDYGLFYTDGTGTDNDGSNNNGALVIAPWNTQGAGGLRIDKSGNLEVRGDVKATKMTVNARWWPDFVFENNYPLMTLDSLDAYIKANGHLPGIPAQDSVIANGQDIGEIQKMQQQKIEELTLYILEQQKVLNQLIGLINEQKESTTAVKK